MQVERPSDDTVVLLSEDGHHVVMCDYLGITYSEPHLEAYTAWRLYVSTTRKDIRVAGVPGTLSYEEAREATEEEMIAAAVERLHALVEEDESAAG